MTKLQAYSTRGIGFIHNITINAITGKKTAKITMPTIERFFLCVR